MRRVIAARRPSNSWVTGALQCTVAEVWQWPAVAALEAQYDRLAAATGLGGQGGRLK